MILEFNIESDLEETWAPMMERAGEAVLDMHHIDGENLYLGVSFVDGEEIRELNGTYRDKDAVTDVLSFPQFESPAELKGALQRGPVSAGDVVICSDRIESQAKELGHSREREMIYLFTHSLLHLLGYDHMEPEEKEEMRAAEETVMKALDLER